MSDTHIDDDATILETRIPEGRRVAGLHYGAHVSRSGSAGYYVRLEGDATERWGVAWLTPARDELPDPEEGETEDEAIVRSIAEELGAPRAAPRLPTGGRVTGIGDGHVPRQRKGL